MSFDDARTILQEGDCADIDSVVSFAFSDEIPSDGVAVAGNLSEGLRQGITDALLAYAATEDGAAVLDSVYEIENYGIANAAAYDVVRDAAEKLGITEG